MAERLCILCFSKVWKNPLLWSHYGNRHKGVAIELEINDNIAHPIKYRKNRYIMSHHSNDFAKPKNKKDLEGLWLTKYEDWSYEEEIRVIEEKKNCINDKGLLFKKFDSEIQIKGLILGPLCEITTGEIETSLPKGNSITVTRSRLAFKSFNIVRQRKFGKKTVHGLN